MNLEEPVLLYRHIHKKYVHDNFTTRSIDHVPPVTARVGISLGRDLISRSSVFRHLKTEEKSQQSMLSLSDLRFRIHYRVLFNLVLKT